MDENRMFYEDFYPTMNKWNGIYRTILDVLYPAKNSTGFPERNLTVNFSKAYEELASGKKEKVVTWFELQFGDNYRKHLDAVLLNTITQELLFVEAKRFSNPQKKIEEVGGDINRIYKLYQELKKDSASEERPRIDIGKVKHVKGIVLADVWDETDRKKEILESFQKGQMNPNSPEAFLRKYENDLKNGGLETGWKMERIEYYVSESFQIPETETTNHSDYYLLAFTWDIPM